MIRKRKVIRRRKARRARKGKKPKKWVIKKCSWYKG